MKIRVPAILYFIMLFVFGVVVGLVARADSVTVTNQVLMVDENKKLNVTNVVGTIEEIAAAAAAAQVADAKASAANAAAAETSSAISNVVADIASKELVVYRYGFTDSFASMVILSDNAKCVIVLFEPGTAVSGSLTACDITYACNEDVSAIVPTIKTSESKLVPRADFTAIPASRVEAVVPQSGTYTDHDGNIYSHVYKVRIWIEQNSTAFYIVYLSAGVPSGDGYTFDIYGGIQNGATTNVVIGSETWIYTGGLFMGVK